MAVGQRICDICENPIVKNAYIEMMLRDMRFPDISIKEDDICPECFERLRSFMRHGMWRLNNTKSD